MLPPHSSCPGPMDSPSAVDSGSATVTTSRGWVGAEPTRIQGKCRLSLKCLPHHKGPLPVTPVGVLGISHPCVSRPPTLRNKVGQVPSADRPRSPGESGGLVWLNGAKSCLRS